MFIEFSQDVLGAVSANPDIAFENITSNRPVFLGQYILAKGIVSYAIETGVPVEHVVQMLLSHSAIKSLKIDPQLKSINPIPQHVIDGCGGCGGGKIL